MQPRGKRRRTGDNAKQILVAPRATIQILADNKKN
jgi:hypothetical protein